LIGGYYLAHRIGIGRRLEARMSQYATDHLTVHLDRPAA